jgi:signal transduction histidine kinase
VTVDESSDRDVAPDVRHDLRHSASTILMLVAMLRSDDHDAATHAAFDGIAHCARSITDMVNTLDEGSAPEAVDVGQLAAQAGDQAGLLYSGTLKVQAEPAFVDANELDVSRLLTNLVQNACRAAGEDGTVHLTVEREDQWSVIRVSDSGTGFVEQPTYAGLGLALVAAIAVRLEGHLTLGGSPLGGALVAVHLPPSRRRDPDAGLAERCRELRS